MRPVIAAAALLFAALAAPDRGRASPIAWVEMTQGGAEARLITSEAACPAIEIDGGRRAMRERAGLVEAFPGRVCVVGLRPGDRAIGIEGLTLRAPLPRPNRLVILGDTGCRIKNRYIQNCNSPTDWPLPRLAILAAAEKPDLVIHVGDYYYRETPCPPGTAACAGSPYGDRLATWRAELFDPAAPLLRAAPWVFARGNHEDCLRGGGGWFRLLDAAAAARSCPAESDTFAVDLGGPRLLVVDGAESSDLLPKRHLVAEFADRLAPLKRLPAGRPVWLITHRPIWNAQRLGDLVADGLVNDTERQAVRGEDLSKVALVVSGHVHNFSSLDFGPRRPSQLVVGTGGDALDLDDAPPPTTGTTVVDGLSANIFTMGRFGYLVLDRHGEDWVGRFKDIAGRTAAVCRLHARSLTCHTPSERDVF